MTDSQPKKKRVGVKIITSDAAVMERNGRLAFKQKKRRAMNAMLRPGVKLKEGNPDLNVEFLVVLIVNGGLKFGGYGPILENFKCGRSLTDGEIPYGIEYGDGCHEESADNTPKSQPTKVDMAKSRAMAISAARKMRMEEESSRTKKQTPTRRSNEQSPDRKGKKTKSDPQAPVSAKKRPKRNASTKSNHPDTQRKEDTSTRDNPSTEICFSSGESNMDADSDVEAALVQLDMPSPSQDNSTSSDLPSKTSAHTQRTDPLPPENVDSQHKISLNESPNGKKSQPNVGDERRNFPIVAKVTAVSDDGIEVTYLERTERPNHWVHPADEKEATCRVVYKDIIKVLDAPGTFVSGSRYYADFGGQIHLKSAQSHQDQM